MTWPMKQGGILRIRKAVSNRRRLSGIWILFCFCRSGMVATCVDALRVTESSDRFMRSAATCAIEIRYHENMIVMSHFSWMPMRSI